MRESELLFQVILTQVACTRQCVGESEEGVKVHRLLWQATCGMAGVCERQEGRGRRGNHLTCQVGSQVASPGAQAPLDEQPGQAGICQPVKLPAGPPSNEAAGRRVKMYVRKALHIFSLGREPTVFRKLQPHTFSDS